METISYTRKKRISRTTKLLLSTFSLIIIAFFVSVFSNPNQKAEAKKFWNGAFDSFGSTFSLGTVESYSPVLKYGLYAANGQKSFANWEMTLLNETLGRKKITTLEMVEEIVVAKENEAVEEASVIDNTLIVDRAVEENANDTDSNVGIIYGENYFETQKPVEKSVDALAENEAVINKLKKTMSLDYLIKNFYIVDATTSINKSVFNVEKLLNKDCSMELDSDKPQILIYHTHGGSESFIDSDGTKKDSVVGAGGELARILTEDYGYNVIHDETCYDVIDGKIERSKAYDKALAGLQKTLKKYPSIEVILDIHRDSEKTKKNRVTTVQGKSTAQFMFFNGLSRNAAGEDREFLKNDKLQGNLAFSLHMKMKAMELYPNIATKIYLKGYRYNLHLREKSVLIELGTNLNTVSEAKNAMEPLAEVLNEVLNE